MIPEEIERLIIKFLSNSTTNEELVKLNSWIQDTDNEEVFKEYVKTHFATTLAMNNPDLEEVRTNLLKEIRCETNKKRGRFKTVFKYAAMAVLFLSLGYFLDNELTDRDANQPIAPKIDAITLQLGNGEIKVISGEETADVLSEEGNVIGVQKGQKLVYEEHGSQEEGSYNTLRIPKGKQFNIELSDGTVVYLNAESSLKFPTTFLAGEERKVFLTGEAFMEVAHDSNIPFIVNTGQLDVKVYGTSFNIANYPEDESTEVVLVEGSVSLKNAVNSRNYKDEVFLEPGFKGSFNKEVGSVEKEKVNTSQYTSWKSGNLVFREISFEKIIQKLERSYNVVIINNNKALAKETFNATIETQYETIEQVLNYFNKVYEIDYIIVENKIVIK
ncbi:FecR family protein [Arenibacter certesii]|uniref:Anti-sigma factor n=1 Tax=Arenibacter certesii TaxID=228955 RepID=A0A918J6K2_9FLAO|nr:FecR family protein [Arenibacter certesii]GGW48517.1 anti-sigma factor [Arenibacter certesii]